MNNTNIDRLSGLWAKQLHAEFSEICWNYKIEITPPVFEISNSANQLGSWQEDTRTIRISSSLILNNSWAVTLNILKHEIAHQICSEIFHSNETAHGKEFALACDLLGLPDEYRKASGDLPDDLRQAEDCCQSTAEGRRFIEKVEKLLALAQSANENEAVLAMQKANELIEKYNLMQIEYNQDASYSYTIINKKKKRIESFQRHICSILRDFFFVKIVTSYLYDPLSDQTHKTIEILGTHENVTIAEYCYHFLENQLSALWSQNRHSYKGNTRTEKNSYYMGLLKGFRTKLQKQKEKSREKNEKKTASSGKSHANIHSLVVAEDARLQGFVQKRFPRLRTVKRQGPKIYKGTFDAGVETGKKITLHKGVSNKDGNIGNLLAKVS